MGLEDDYKEALSRWASGVCVVTTNADGMLYGLTVSSFSSLSLDPPLVLVRIHNQNRLPGMIEVGGRFAISVLAHGQEAASRYFARAGRLPTPDFTEIEGEWVADGQAIVKGAMAWLACSLHEAIEEGDHTIVIGRVLATGADPDRRPLVYFRRGYHTL